jgi:hypothetical protein
MIVVADLFIWTMNGMKRDPSGNWMQKDEVECLLKEAHQRGRLQGVEEAREVVKSTIGEIRGVQKRSEE